MSDLNHDQALQLMAVSKLCSASLVWSVRDNHVGLLLASAQPEDESGAILPGLTLQFEIKRPIVVDRCLYEFGLFLLGHGVRRRVYQLNARPPTSARTTARWARCTGRMNMKATGCCPSTIRMSHVAAQM